MILTYQFMSCGVFPVGYTKVLANTPERFSKQIGVHWWQTQYQQVLFSSSRPSVFKSSGWEKRKTLRLSPQMVEPLKTDKYCFTWTVCPMPPVWRRKKSFWNFFLWSHGVRSCERVESCHCCLPVFWLPRAVVCFQASLGPLSLRAPWPCRLVTLSALCMSQGGYYRENYFYRSQGAIPCCYCILSVQSAMNL